MNKMIIDRATVQQALDALEEVSYTRGPRRKEYQAIAALREALAAPQQEPQHGWKLTPPEATSKMYCAGAEAITEHANMLKAMGRSTDMMHTSDEALTRKMYKAMLAAAPQHALHQQPDAMHLAAVELARQQHARITELESEAIGHQAELAGYEHTIGNLSALVDELRAEQQAKPSMELYGWAVTGVFGVFRGDTAQQDAESVARRCGGTERAFALYREAPQV